MIKEQRKNMKILNVFHNVVTAWIVLGVTLILTIAAYYISNHFGIQRAKDRFEFRSKEIAKVISERLRVYEQQLWSSAGMMYSVDNMTRVKFAKFIETMDIEKHWPGIQGIGFAVPVKPENKQALIDAIRAEGFPDFTINPEGDREMYTAIIYLEPFNWRNQRAFGYDMWSNEMRRAAMTRARDEGGAATSGIITLVQETDEDVQKGFLTYVPLYKTKKIPQTVEERRSQFIGWVYAAYRAGNLMRGVIGSEDPNIEFEVYDGEKMERDALLFDSNGSLHLEEQNYQREFDKTVQVINQGRIWTLYFSTPRNFMMGGEQKLPRLIALVGCVVDLLIFYVIWSLASIKKRAEAMAKDMTVELERSNIRLEETVRERTSELLKARNSLEEQVHERTKELNEKVTQLERMNLAMVGREKKMIELKQEIERLKR